jgi:UDP-GlcNAc:undecaprenyl-phosphate/decaprenyl-phosphate GlcNAc-1-phosphate transferase
MAKYNLLTLLGIGFSLVLTPLSRRLAMRLGAIDKPSERRIHVIATPRLGGSALLPALMLTLACASMLDSLIGGLLWSEPGKLIALAIGAVMITLCGAIDDVTPLRPIIKLTVEIAAGCVVVYGGYRIDSLAGFPLGILSIPLTVFFIVSVVNALNLVDGLDGLAVGLCLISTATLFLLCLSNGQLQCSLTLAALAGVLLGFLPYNFHPAKTFLGDSGAMLLGFLLAVAAISILHQTAATAAMLAPFLALGMPLVELLLTTARRILRAVCVVRLDGDEQRYEFSIARPTLMCADRDHIHHRLLGLGLSHRAAVLLLYGVGALMCALALGIASRREIMQWPLLAAVVMASIAGVRWLGYRELMPLRSGLLLPVFESGALRRKALHVMTDLIFIVASYTIALLFEYSMNGAVRALLLVSMPVVAGFQIASFGIGGLYRRSWRHAAVDDVVAMAKALAIAIVSGALVSEWIAAALVPSFHLASSVIVLDGYFLATSLLGSRLSFRLLDHMFQRERPGASRVLIYGAGRCGALALNEIRENPALGMTPAGFLDDDARKCGVKVHGATVYHTLRVGHLIGARAFDLVVLSTRKIKPARTQMLTEQCRRAGIDVVRFEIAWQGAVVGDAAEIAPPRRAALVVPIRSATAPR